jgi:two-component system chemotaxis response regulator CheB
MKKINMPKPHTKNGSEKCRPAGDFRAVVIGVSAGGLDALGKLLPALPASFPLPILIVQHRRADSDDYLSKSLDRDCAITVKEAEEKEALRGGTAYLAPANYHLLVERDETLALSVEPKENFSRPSIDVLFESASYVWAERLIGIILTGANKDGAKGLALIKQRGGTAIVQDPAGAEYDAMPKAAINAGAVDAILPIPKIASLLKSINIKP